MRTDTVIFRYKIFHASGGCDLQPGDLLGTGTISAPDDDGLGSLIEMTRGGKHPITLPS